MTTMPCSITDGPQYDDNHSEELDEKYCDSCGGIFESCDTHYKRINERVYQPQCPLCYSPEIYEYSSQERMRDRMEEIRKEELSEALTDIARPAV